MDFLEYKNSSKRNFEQTKFWTSGHLACQKYEFISSARELHRVDFYKRTHMRQSPFISDKSLITFGIG